MYSTNNSKNDKPENKKHFIVRCKTVSFKNESFSKKLRSVPYTRGF